MNQPTKAVYPSSPAIELNALYVCDLEVYKVNLPRGDYLIDDHPVTSDQYGNLECECSSVDNIRKVTTIKEIIGRIDKSGDIISNEEYSRLIKEAQKKYKAIWNDKYDEFFFEDPEDEAAYNEYTYSFKIAYDTRTKTSEPLHVHVMNINLDTGSKYITSGFAIGKAPELYEYNQSSYILHEAVPKVVEEFGLDVTKVDCSHSIQYLKYGSEYMFTKEFENARIFRGALEEMKDRMESDYQTVKFCFKKHVTPDIEGYSAEELFEFLDSLYSAALAVESKSKTQRNQSTLLTKISNEKVRCKKLLMEQDNS